MKEYRPYLEKYFPDAEIVDESKEIERLAKNQWLVINCKIYQLEEQLKMLPPGRKQIEMARYQDEVTVIIDQLDVVY